jgi:hypothetical protein
MFKQKIEVLYGHHSADRAPMYKAIGDRLAHASIQLAVAGEFTKANSASDLAREYREAAQFLASKDAGLGI